MPQKVFTFWCLKRFLPFEAPQRSVKIKTEVSDYAPVMSTFICIKTLKSMFRHIDNTFSNTLIISKILQIIVFIQRKYNFMVPKMVNIRLTKFRYDSTWFRVKTSYRKHCVKTVQMRIFFWSVFFCIRTEYGDFSVNLHIQSEYRKIWTRKNSADTFHAEKKFTIMQTQSNFVNINVDLTRSFDFKILLRK